MRWAVTGVALLTAVLASVAGSDGSAKAGPAEPPNVVVVMTDDQRVSDMAVMPQTRLMIGKRGVTFRRSYATFPLCCPSRATYHTGLYAHNHGVESNLPPDGGASVFRDSGLDDDTTAVALQAAGYQTALYGKYMNGYTALANEVPPYLPPGYTEWGALASAARMYNWRQIIDGQIVFRESEPSDYQTDVLARQSARFIRSSAALGAPFFLSVMPIAPHTETRFGPSSRNPRPAKRDRGAFDGDPLVRPPAFNEADVSDKPTEIRDQPRLGEGERLLIRNENNDRRASLLAVDDLVARLVDELKTAGQLGNTLFIFTSDNGFLLGEHRLTGKNKPYDESARVPLLVRGPGIPVGRRVGAPVGNIDLAATIYEATGVEPLLEPDGLSLRDVVADPGDFSDRELLIETITGVGIRTRDFLYFERRVADDEVELYDADLDPYQLDSVHADPDYTGERLDLAARLDQLRDCEGQECH